MKKPKLKIDTAQIKAFFKEHGEKFVVAIAVAILVSFAISAINRETLPENLRAPKILARADEANTKITNSKPPAKIVPNLDFVGGVAAWSAGIQPGAYKLSNPLSTPAFPDPVKRTDPTLFPVAEIQVVPFVGAVTMNAALAPVAAPAEVAPPAGGVRPGTPAPAPAVTRSPAREPVRPGRVGGILGGPGGLPPAGALPGNIGNIQAGPQPIPASMQLPGPQSTGFAEYRTGVMVTALIPEEAQRDEYERVFQHARKISTDNSAGGSMEIRNQTQRDSDTPRYVWCRLERTDMTDGSVKLFDFGDVEQVRADWKFSERRKVIAVRYSAEFKKLEEDVRDWGVQIPEVVDPEYVEAPWLTWPLPPVLLHDWGHDAAHPKIPLVAAQASDAAPNGATKPGDQDNNFGGDDKGVPAGPIGPRGPALRYPPRVPGMSMRGPTGMVGGPDQLQAPAVPYKLFRFVDFDVQPTHAYEYRVQLLVRNPNYGLEPQLLAKPDPNAPIYRETPWSAKSNIASFPSEVQLVSAGINRQHRAEPKGTLGILMWDKPDAIQLLRDADLELGDVANFGERQVKDVVDAVTRTIRDVTANFQSGSALVDLRGNEEKLPGTDNLTEPGELLLLTNIGDPAKMQLIVLNEAADRPTVEAWDKTHKAPAGAAAGVGAVGSPTVVKPIQPGPIQRTPPGVNNNGLPPSRTPTRPNTSLPAKTR